VQDIDMPAFEMACRNLASATLWSERGTSEVAVASLSSEFLQLAALQAAGVIMAGRDPNITTRAINYLAYTHIAPSGIDAKWWFNETLKCLLELAVPSTIQTPESSAFLLDIYEGIAESTRAAND
jgi:hypothetical protein